MFGFTSGVDGLFGFTSGVDGLFGFTSGVDGLFGFTSGVDGLFGFTSGTVLESTNVTVTGLPALVWVEVNEAAKIFW